MPILGHAFVGLATGLVVTPRRRRPPEPRPPSSRSLWLPAMVVLAYLPDIAAQVVQLAGHADARLATHSVLFAVLASLVIAPLLLRAFPLTWRAALLICLFSILTHDLMDLLQATDRAPWWPFSDRRVDIGVELLPAEPWVEALVFATGFALFLAGRRLVAQPGARRLSSDRPGRAPASATIGLTLTAALVLAAAGTHYLRDVRERQLESARQLIEHGQPTPAFPLLEQAERWPSTAKPGRIDYLRAEAHVQLGDRARAERYYLQAYRADPGYFWTVADLALFYASSDGPAPERRRLAAPYLARLQHDFADTADLRRLRARIERKLAEPR